jgi:hypothetical protein
MHLNAQEKANTLHRLDHSIIRMKSLFARQFFLVKRQGVILEKSQNGMNGLKRSDFFLNLTDKSVN